MLFWGNLRVQSAGISLPVIPQSSNLTSVQLMSPVGEVQRKHLCLVATQKIPKTWLISSSFQFLEKKKFPTFLVAFPYVKTSICQSTLQIFP